MRVVVQRVRGARVEIDGETAGEVVGAIGHGLLALVGAGRGDTPDDADALADKTAKLRIFADPDGRTNLAVTDVGGAVLVVSQFTLYADTRKGNRPSFVAAADPDLAADLVERYRRRLEHAGVPTAAGVFGAAMAVHLSNDGPFTVLLERGAPAPP